MKLRVKHLFLIAALFSQSFVSHATEGDGPGTGGGGGFVLIDQELTFVDLLNILTVQEVKALNKNVAEKVFEPEASVKNSKASASFSLLRDKKSGRPVFDKASEIFERWENVPFDVVSSMMHGALNEPLQWRFVKNLNIRASFNRPANLPADAQFITAAYYTMTKTAYTVRIDRGIWNQLSSLNQVGLIIHEGLRQLQIGYINEFDDATLQKAAAVMMLCKPSVTLSQYLFFLVMKRPDLAADRLGSFESVTAQCKGAL